MVKIQENENQEIEFSDNESEVLVLKQLVNPINKDFTLFIFENFEPRFFKNENRATIFKICKNYWTHYEKIPTSDTIKSILNNEKFSDKKIDLQKEYDLSYSYNEEGYNENHIKDLLIKFVKLRLIYFTMLDQFDDIEKNGEVGDCLRRFEKIVQLDMGDDLGIEYFENLENHCNSLLSIESRQPFGFRDLDRYTYGGLPTNHSDTCLFIIMAKPGLGKSQFMMNIAANWVLANKKVLMISLEMSEDMYSRRMDGLFADINVNKLKENVGLLKSRIKGVKANIPNALLRIKEFPTGQCSPALLKQFLNKLKVSYDFEPDLICVDYLNIMKPNGNNPGMNLYEKCARISEELRAISCELKVPIITATQSNRSGASGGYAGANIDMSNVSESAGITATADALMALYQLDGEREIGRLNLKILKNRLGGYVDRTISFNVDYETLKISDMEEDGGSADENDILSGAEGANDDLFKGENISTKEITNNSNAGIIEDL